MHATTLSSLDAHALSDRLRALAGEERDLQADFLLHLDELDRRRSFAELGYPSLWEYCLRALHLREGAAGRRIDAMRVLRRFPQLEAALRDGRLCLSTLCQLGPVLDAANVADLSDRAAFKTKGEVDAIVASVRPRRAPADGVRLLAQPASPFAPLIEQQPAALDSEENTVPNTPALQSVALEELPQPAVPVSAAVPAPHREVHTPQHRKEEVRAIAAETWSLRVTLDAEAKRDLEALTELLAHKIRGRDLAAVLKEALHCAIEKHGKRRGAIEPARPRPPRPTLAHVSTSAAAPASDLVAANESAAASERAAAGPVDPRSIPAAIRREVWRRDAGRCTFASSDGTRCGSRWKLELDHVKPVALGGAATLENLRLRCRTHNLLHAEAAFGRARMERHRSAKLAR